MSMPSAASNALNNERRYRGGPRRILIVVTAGGFTNAAPLLELGRILALRGYEIQFGSLQGRESWVNTCDFVSRFHTLGPALAPGIEEAKYLEMTAWSSGNWKAKLETRRFLESSWPDAYRSLSELVNDPSTRPDMILSDYWVDATRDISFEHDIPLAMHWPQMPTAMLHAPYIPGTPGLQIDILSSEYATLWQRWRSSIAIYTSALHYYRYLRWRKHMRSEAGVYRQLPTLTKPDYLCLVNSLFGFEVPKDIPPNVAAVGPILSDSVDSLGEPYTTFLAKRSKVLYVCLGTHVLLPSTSIEKLLLGALASLKAGEIDGIIWPMRPMARSQLDGAALMPVYLSQESHGESTRASVSFMSITELLNGSHPALLFTEFAPQRSLLQDERVAIFLSHGGPASANEALFAGIPLVTLSVYFDQVQNEMRLRDAGVSIPLDKHNFSATDVGMAIGSIAQDQLARGPITANVERMQRIARIAARRKYLAVDLIEEVLADHEGRRLEREALKSQSTRAKPRYMHLQTADVRMPFWKAKNWDLYGACIAVSLCIAGLIIALPVAISQTIPRSDK